MRLRQTFVAVILILSASAALSGDILARPDRVPQAVSEIVAAQFDGGEAAAIQRLQACYQRIDRGPSGLTPALENCVAQDIAYANFATGFYRELARRTNKPQGQLRIEYTTLEAMRKRVYGAMEGAGLREPELTHELKGIAAVALKSLAPAIQSHVAK